MKSKHIVIQVDIDVGTQWGDSRTINPIREIFIPSVKAFTPCFAAVYPGPVSGVTYLPAQDDIFIISPSLCSFIFSKTRRFV